MLAATLLLQAAAPQFAPPLDTSLLVRTERVERGLEDRRFTLERVVRFARDADGFRAEVHLRDVRSNAADPVPRLTELGFAGLIGRTIVVHLSSAGRVTAVEGQTALWSHLSERLATVAASRRALPPVAREALAQRIAAPLRALPAERQRDALGTLASAIIPDEPGEPVGTVRPVEITGVSPLGGPVLLKGSKATRAAGDMIETTTRAEAVVALPAEGDAPARSGRVALERIVRIDAVTGLISRSSETTRTSVSGQETVRITTIEVTSAPPQPPRTP